MLTYVDGRFLPDSEATISVRSRGLNYGLGCFAGVRGYLADDGQQVFVFRLDDHVRRLELSAKMLFLRSEPFAQARQAVLDVVCHPLFRAAGRRDRWGLCAAELRIRRGRDWSRLERETQPLEPGLAEAARGAETRSLREAVASVADREWPGVATWHAHAEAHRSAMREAFCTEGLLDQEAEVARAECSWAVFPLVRLRPEQVIGSMLQASSITTIDQNSHLFTRALRFFRERERRLRR